MAVGIYIRPTIPDNEGRTAFAVLRRLGVEVTGLERAVLLLHAEDLDLEAVEASVRADEALFNPNIHALQVSSLEAPGPGEVWIESDLPDRITIAWFGEVRRVRAWTLRGSEGPAGAELIGGALGALLLNLAVEHLVERIDGGA
jgi:phosphoribosylformylglycinamidine (FGAM) synthase PurS component